MIKFYRGLKASYVQATHGEGIYFATDTAEILVNGVSYGVDQEKVKDVSFDSTKNVLTFKRQNKDDLVVDFGNKLLSDEDRSAVDRLKEALEGAGFTANYETELDDDLATLTAIGGIPAGTKVSKYKNKPLSNVVDDLLFPTVQPVATKNSVSIARKSSAPEIKEVGAAAWTASDFSVTANRGYYTISGKHSNPEVYYAGAASNLTVNNVPVETTYGSHQVTGSATFAAGDQPKDSKGNNASGMAPYAGGTLTSSAVTVYAAYPFYANSTSISAFNKLPLVKPTVSTFEVNFPAEEGSHHHSVRVPSSHKLTKAEMFNTLSNKYEEILLSNFTKEEGTIDDSMVLYTTYIRNQGINGDAKFRFTYNNA